MAETITLFLNTQAQTQGITATVRGLNQVKQGVEQLGRNFGALASRIAAFAAPLTALIGAGALTRFTKDAIDNADALAKAAQRAGISVESFSALAHASSLADASIQDLQTATRQLSEWLEKTGQGSRDLMEVLLEQADTFAAMEDGAQKIALAQERFGRSGQLLIPLLNQGSAAIREQMEEARAFGLMVGPGFAARAQQFNDNITRIRGLLRGLFNRVAEGVLPGLIELTESVIAWGRENAERIGLFLQDAVAMTVRAYKESRLGELIALIVEVGIREGGVAGVKALGFLFGKLFTVDFFMLAAKAGRLLAEVLLRAVKLPVDAFGAGMDWVISNAANGFGKAFVGIFNWLSEKFVVAVNFWIAAMNKIPGVNVAPIQAVQLEFRGPKVPSFGEIFAEHQKASQESMDAVLVLMDEQIEKSRQLLTDGQISEDQAQALVTARERLLALYDREVRARQEAAKAESAPTIRRATTEQRAMDLTILRERLEQSATRIKLIELDVTLSARQRNKELRDAYFDRALIVDQMRTALERVVQEGDARGPAGRTEEHTKAVKELNAVLLQQAEIQKQLFELDQDSFFGRFQQNIRQAIDNVSSFGARVADIFTTGIGSAIDTVANGIWAVIDGTRTWGEMFRDVARSIISQLIALTIRALVFRAIMAFLPGFGSFLGIPKLFGMQEGGIVPGGPQIIMVNEAGPEAILNARTTAMLGAEKIAALNAGIMDFERQRVASVAPPSDTMINTGASSRSGESFASQASAGGSGIQHVTILIVDRRDKQGILDTMASAEGKVIVADMVRNNRLEIGVG